MCIRDSDCTAHFIRTDLLTAGVLSNLRKVTSYAAKDVYKRQEYILTLCGDTVIFSSGLLAEALSRLDEREREMIRCV